MILNRINDTLSIVFSILDTLSLTNIMDEQGILRIFSAPSGYLNVTKSNFLFDIILSIYMLFVDGNLYLNFSDDSATHMKTSKGNMGRIVISGYYYAK